MRLSAGCVAFSFISLAAEASRGDLRSWCHHISQIKQVDHESLGLVKNVAHAVGSLHTVLAIALGQRGTRVSKRFIAYALVPIQERGVPTPIV